MTKSLSGKKIKVSLPDLNTPAFSDVLNGKGTFVEVWHSTRTTVVEAPELYYLSITLLDSISLHIFLHSNNFKI